MSILQLRDVRYSYENKYQKNEVLRGISAEFEQGKVYALIGKSGSGKSTALTLMAGLELPDAGDILYEGTSTKEMDLNSYRREKAAVIYQSFQLFPLLTAVENVMYPMELRGMKGKEAMEKAKDFIRQVGLPEEIFHRFPNMISGGEQQRVAIARALAMNTRLLLADEPTGNLDTANSQNVIDILVRLAHEENYCVIIVTHDMGLLEKMDVVYRMQDGMLCDCT
ncbi:MAG: ABC transporter ATP-binding protein [Roseburia sp.]|nr:ABC transporter ATP-binding protein [Roseburia sp.]